MSVSRAFALLAAGAVAACGAHLADPAATGADAAGAGRDAAIDAAPDAAIDARPCTGSADGEGHCFIYHSSAAPWATAKSACEADGAHLAIITDLTQNQTVLSIIGTTAPAFIGATDQVVEGQFVWVDGTPLQFSNFDTGEPNNGNGAYEEDCLVMRTDGTRAGKWDDRPCALEANAGTAGVYPYVCEF